MALFSRTTLTASALAVATAALVATPGSAYSGCAFSKLGTPNSAAHTPGLDGDAGLAASPDANALGVALGGLGAIAALLAGGTLVARRYGAEAAPVTDAAVEFALDTETVVLPDTPRVETPEAEVALAVRR
jgi:hypothetical protein